MEYDAFSSWSGASESQTPHFRFASSICEQTPLIQKINLIARQVRSFAISLLQEESLILRSGIILLTLVPLYLLLAYGDATAALNNPWFKPIKFAISFATFLWTVAAFLLAVKLPAWQKTLARRIVCGSVAIEMVCLTVQAWRVVHAQATATLLDRGMNQALSSAILVITAFSIWLLWLFCGAARRIAVRDGILLVSIRASLIIFLMGNAIGGYMLARGSHTVGASDGGPGLPFLRWSTVAGDLRISHFIALHAIQLLPLFAWAISQFTPLGLVQRRRALWTATALMSLVIAGTFVQALMAKPMLAAKAPVASRVLVSQVK